MKCLVVFITNMANHYQCALAEAMIRNGIEYHVITNEHVPEERLRGGFSEDFEKKPYVLNAYEDCDKVKELVMDADLVITSYDGNRLVRTRVREGKPVWIYSERLFKHSGKDLRSCFRNILRFIKYYWLLRLCGYIRQCCFLLIGPYAIGDYRSLGVRSDRILRYAYFPETSRTERHGYCPEGVIRIIWVGRLRPWKHPDLAVKVIRRLFDEGYPVTLKVIGGGKMYDALATASVGYPITITGAVPVDEVRKHLRSADVFLFTSDAEEGWGTVLNEAMSEGVVPIADRRAGATTWLVDHGNNGLIYDGSEEQLYQSVRRILRDPEVLPAWGDAARKTMESCWNGDVAARNMMTQYESIRRGSPQSFEGPFGGVG